VRIQDAEGAAVTDGEWPLPGLDVTKPNVARVYDAFLGGKDNFAIDRQVVEFALDVTPDAAVGARANRAFLRRVVRYLTAEAGIRQFVDIGSGLPTQGNVHEVAQGADPAARVVYVDVDPMVRVHALALLAQGPGTAFITADLREPEIILNDAAVAELIDFRQPVALLLFAILHHINDAEDPGGIVARLREAVVPGSYLAISSFRMPGPEHPEDAARTAEMEKLFNEKLGTGRWRSHDEILAWFGDWELVEPGLVPLPEWRPDIKGPVRRDATYHGFVGGVARKP
jgi:S-adenosyl methyltransferase